MRGGVEPPSDEHITMLLSMGFSDVEYIRKALQLAKNDLNEAVAILTGEVNRGGFGSPNDVEMKEASQSSDQASSHNNNLQVATMYGPHQEESKTEETLEVTDDEVLESIEMLIEDMPEEFPVTNLYELEDRLFTDNWSIPYKRHESLAKCIYSSIKLVSLLKAEQDENCARFLDRVLPECFNKLLFSQAVKKWTGDIHEGVYNMIKLFIDLATLRLKYEPVPLNILATLAQCLDPESEFHFKNRSRKWDRAHNEDLFGYEKCPAVSPPYNTYKEPFGWLVDLINRFAFKGGFDAIVHIVDRTDKLTPNLLSALLKPFGLCAKYLNAEVIGSKLGPTVNKVVHYIKDLQPNDMKEKEVDKVFDLLRSLHFICESLWPDMSSAIDELHLNTILKMLKLPHFNARMNALKELCRLLKEAESGRWSNITQQDVILKWLVENKVLSIAFSSSVHHSQYCEKLKKIVEFAGVKISNEELTNIWNMQSGKHVTVVDNIHTIISSAVQNFSTDQMTHLIFLLETSWKEEDQKSKERLLLLIGKIGQEIRDVDIVLKLLNMLWEVSHIEGLPMYLVNQAVQSHLDVLTESNTTRTNVKTEYVVKCVQDIKKHHWVVPAIRHLLNNLQSIIKQPNSKNSRAVIQEIQNQHNLLKLLCQSLIECHKAATLMIPAGTLSGETIIDNMYTYAETVITHLKLIEFLLQDGGLYLGWNRCKEIWDCLMLDGQNCDGDYETCLEWFVNCITDLQPETQKDLFTSKILKTDVHKMREIGYKCFKSYFESVNINEHKMKRNGPSIVVEKQDLTGLPYLWQLVLETPYDNIAHEAMQYLVNVSFSRLSSKLKKTEYVAVHKRFINECYKKLENLLVHFRECNDTGPKEGKIIKTFKRPLPMKDSASERSKVLLSIERLLNLSCLYIGTVEEIYTAPRSFPPHGSCFHGYPIQLHINCESNKSEFDISCHSNESMHSVRQKIASKLSSNIDHVQIYKTDKVLLPPKDHKLLSQLEFGEKQHLLVKIVTIGTVNGSSANNNDDDLLPPTNKPSLLLEREKALPSFLMAVEYKLFDKLYELAELEEQKITNALKNLFLHLPTDADVLQAIDIFSLQNPLLCSPGTRAGYARSSSSVLENYFKCSAPKMSTFRVLYNLQVLSSKLMPVLGNEPRTVADSFKENWLNAGGLSLIMNILIPNTLPSNADYELRQNCYYIILQLARFLLCGDSYETNLITAVPVIRTFGQMASCDITVSSSSYSMPSQGDSATVDVPMTCSTPIKAPVLPRGQARQQTPSNASSWPGARGSQSGSPVSTAQLSSSPGSAASFTPENESIRKRLRSSSVLDTVSPTVKMVIENLNEEEFTETISSLVQVAWSAAAGQLQLNTRLQNKGDITSNSNEELKAGICLHQENVSHMDSVLANNSLELLVMCLQLRPTFLSTFYNMTNVSEFIIDVLTGSPSLHVRESASLHFSVLANTPMQDTNVQHPKQFFLNILMKSHLPLWTVSGSVRGVYFKVLLQCQEFFNLLCNVIYLLSLTEQIEYDIDPCKLLDDELEFLTNSDNVNVELLLSHLKFACILFTCEGVNKKNVGYNFIQFLLDDFLFLTSKSKLANVNTSISNFNLFDINVNSFDSICRKESFNLLLTLADRCPENLCEIASQLISMHHNQMNSNEWDFHPPTTSRPINGFVGLQNAGATCYMNSIIQQLYMQPGLRESVLKIDYDKSKTSSSILFQIQNIFGHLLEAQSQYYAPENFWKSFKLWGEPVNLREQQDAFEFFTNITDQLDESLKNLRKEEIFKKTFCGMFVDQKICNECSHNFERDEPFFSLPVTVNCGQLEASLEQFVHSEIMEGDNAYYCEKCCERRTTKKRTCLKTLPPVLVIQLKRFWYDWERNRAIKFDDFFSFPWILDMEPYTCDGISRREKEKESSSPDVSDNKSMQVNSGDSQYSYELVGIVVHSGQASAGHYYSFIKNRQNTYGEFNKWYKFNDICVEQVNMNDELLESECYGGEYRVPQSDSNNQYPENRIRNWNAYMLFYETTDKNKLLPCSTLSFQDPRGQILGDMMRSYPGSPASSSSSNPPSPGSKDSLSQLSALIRKGDRKGLFNDNMPATIKQIVNEDNMEFMHNRDVYNEDYFQFVRQLCSSNISGGTCNLSEEEQKMHIQKAFLCCTQLAANFLFNTYFKTSKFLRSDVESWIVTLETLISASSEACFWFLDLLGSEKGKEYILAYLIECPDKANREAFASLLFLACNYYVKFERENLEMLSRLISQLFSLLDKDIVHHMKNSAEYFSFFYKYACLSRQTLVQLAEKQCFRRFLSFLLGPASNPNTERNVRRWTTQQAQEFTSLHNTLAMLILNSDNRHLQTVSSQSPIPPNTNLFKHEVPIPMSSDIGELLYGETGDRYLYECFYASTELPQVNIISELILFSCWCNMQYSIQFMRQCQLFLLKAQVNDIKNPFSLLTDVLELQDSLQEKRIKFCIEGSKEHDIEGLFSVIHSLINSDARRAYHCIKFLVAVANKLPLVKDFLLLYCSKWHWVVDWLKKKMSDYSYWPSQSNSSTEPHSSFKRTMSAQNTLAEATKLLTEFESRDQSKIDQSGSSMVTSSPIMEEEVT